MSMSCFDWPNHGNLQRVWLLRCFVTRKIKRGLLRNKCRICGMEASQKCHAFTQTVILVWQWLSFRLLDFSGLFIFYYYCLLSYLAACFSPHPSVQSAFENCLLIGDFTPVCFWNIKWLAARDLLRIFNTIQKTIIQFY